MDDGEFHDTYNERVRQLATDKEVGRDANIHGRSKMTREQLEDALRIEAAGHSAS